MAKKTVNENEEKSIGPNKLEKYTMVTLKRDSIVGAEYNPRKISEEAKKKLRGLIQKHGMVQPPIVNKRTMRIVGGHQRIDIMDSLLRKKDYQLTVAMIDVDEKDEMKINVSLNNTSAQGSWDIDLLEQIKIENPEFDFQEDFAFNAVDLESMFFDSEAFFPKPKANVDLRPAPPVRMGGGNDDIESDDFDDEENFGESFVDDFDDEPDPNKELDEQAKIDKIKEQKRKYREEKRGENAEGASMQVMSDDYTVKLVFNSNEDKWRFMHNIKKPIDETHIKPTFLYDLAKKKISLKNNNPEKDNEVHIVFQVNSEKRDFMRKIRMPQDETLVNPSILAEIEDGKINLEGE